MHFSSFEKFCFFNFNLLLYGKSCNFLLIIEVKKSLLREYYLFIFLNDSKF